jgi:hypothetical protein
MKYHHLAVLGLLVALTLAVTQVSAEATTSAEIQVNAEAEVKTDARRIEVQQQMRELKTRSTSSETRISAQASSTMPGVREAVKDKVCGALETRIDKRLENFGTIYERHKAFYEAHREDLLTLAAKLDVEGISTVKIRADLAVLQTKIKALEDERSAVRTALENSKGLSCGTGDGLFRAEIEKARVAQKNIVAGAADAATFVRTTLRQDVIDLRVAYQEKNKKESN